MAERAWLTIFCHFMVLFSFAESQVIFTSTYNDKVNGTVGATVKFTWTFNGSVRSAQLDRKDETLIVIDQSSTVHFPTSQYSGRIGAVWNGTSQVTFWLNLSSISDEGTYECGLLPQTLDGEMEKSGVDLVVFELPKIYLLSVRDRYEEGSLVNITCKSDGKPEPMVEWWGKGSLLSFGKTKASMIISNVSRNVDGNYSCHASNSVGRNKSHFALVVIYPPTVQDITASSNNSWIGQTITLTCISDGLPTPTLTWSHPDGRNITSVKANVDNKEVALEGDQDFGDYKCTADNGLGPSDYRIIKITQIKKPGVASIISNEEDIQASSLRVRWTAPADNGGSPITAYYLIIQGGDTKKASYNSTDPGITNRTFGGLKRDTNYTVKVLARNFVFEGDAAVKTMRTKFQGAPATVEIYNIPSETKSAEITLLWKEPENNGGIITEYFVYQRIVTDGEGGQWLILKNIMGSSVKELTVPLEKGKEYEFAVTAKNAFGEGLKQDESRIRRVKAIGIPGKVEIYNLPDKTSDDAVTLKWKKPEIYGKEITRYTVYRRTVTGGRPGKWIKLKEISDVKVREFKVSLESGKVYQFAVTATNEVGESLKPAGRKIPQVKALGSPGLTTGSPVGGENGMNTAIYSGAAVAGVLLIIGIIVIIVLWRRRKPSSPDNDEMAMNRLGSANHYEADDGYQEASRAEAAQTLQASGPDAEANYAQVDMTKKKKNRPPPSDEYAQVEKSKKTKKRPKRPGELDYADLEDLRVGLVLGPSGATAPAAVVRPPAYEGTDYADITQFGVPQPDPTYANVSKGDVAYSNMQSM